MVGLKPVYGGSIPSFLVVEGRGSYEAIINVGSSKVWWGGGEPWSHSRFETISSTERTSRFEEKASQTMNKNKNTAITEIAEPIEERMFQAV